MHRRITGNTQSISKQSTTTKRTTTDPLAGGETRRAVTAAVGALLVGLLLAWVSTAGGVGLWTEPTWEPAPATPEPRSAELVPSTPAEPEFVPIEDTEPAQLPEWLADVMRVLTIGVLMWGAVALARLLWRNRPRVQFRRPTRNEDVVIVPDIAGAVVAEAEAQRRALKTGEVRNAIVACWLRLEHDVEATGLQPDPADTAAEFVERVLASYSLNPQAIHQLADLYREARFSDHAMGEPKRDAALAALEQLHADLSRTVPS